MMKLLLTSAGIKNTSIHDALVDLLGKPIAESSALRIPTAAYPMGGPRVAWRMITGRGPAPLCELGWKSLGVLELTAMPSIDEERGVLEGREAAVPGQEPCERKTLGISERGLDHDEGSEWGGSGHRAPPGRAETRRAGPAASPSD